MSTSSLAQEHLSAGTTLDASRNLSSEDVDVEKQATDLSSNSDAGVPDDEEPVTLLVEFPADDPEKPINWSFRKKALHTALYGATTLTAQYNSASMSAPAEHLMTAFGISRPVATLATSLYVLGVAFGPMIFAPFSEVYGRKPGVLIPFMISGVFTLGTASSKSISAILCTRFFAGLFASAPVVSSGGVLADLYLPAQRGVSLVFYSYFVVSGTTFAPIISALLTKNSPTAWTWAPWFVSIIIFVVFAVDVLVLSETYVPVLLARRAKKLRHSTGNWAIHAKHEEWQFTFSEFMRVHLIRPFALLATPIVFFIAMFASYVFGILYLMITALSQTFQMERGWGYTTSQLPMIGLFCGSIIGGLFNIWGGKRYARLVAANGGKSLPEERFPTMMYAGWLMPAGIFMFAWTSSPHVHWIVPIIGIAIMGMGFLTIFQGCLNYLVDAFTRYSASAIAANTFTRSVFGAVFPLFAPYLFQNLGVNWGASLIGFIALGMIPIPFVFYALGEKIRAKNPYIQLIS